MVTEFLGREGSGLNSSTKDNHFISSVVDRDLTLEGFYVLLV